MVDKPIPSPMQNLKYKQPERITDEEKTLLRRTFKDNDLLLNLLKKLMIPQYADPDNPFEMSGADAFNLGRDWASMPHEEVKALVVARQDTINWIAGALTWLKMEANKEEETAEELAARIKKDSAR